MSKEVVLCVSNAYQKKYYLNENFNGLPQTIRDELKIMCVLYTEDVGGILELVFDEDGKVLGVQLSEYLLEKSRVVEQHPGLRWVGPAASA